jgi:hypothetical protein
MDTLKNLMEVSRHSMPSEGSIRNTIKLHNRYNHHVSFIKDEQQLCDEKFINKFEEIIVLYRLGLSMNTIINQLNLTRGVK